MMTILKKIPLWGWLCLVLAALLVWQAMSGWAMAGKLYKQALDTLREDKTAIVERQQQALEETQKNLSEVQLKLETVRQQMAQAKAESLRLKGLVDAKDIQILALQKERDEIIISGDINVVADEFRRRGYKPRIVIPAP
jgi:hypothetical protein